MNTGVARIAGAPISWGVCEVPGWGFQLDPSLVLTQMRNVGLVATELGPEGFLPTDPQEAATTLRHFSIFPSSTSCSVGFTHGVVAGRSSGPITAGARERSPEPDDSAAGFCASVVMESIKPG